MTTLTKTDIAEYHEEDFDRAQDTFKDLFKQINVMGVEKPMKVALARTIANEHRYLQSEMISMLIDVVVDYADTEYFDGRNESMVELCKKIKNVL